MSFDYTKVLFCFRLCGVVHVLFYVLHIFLNGNEESDDQNFDLASIPEHVDTETVRTVEEIVKYFASQRRIINKVIQSGMIYDIYV